MVTARLAGLAFVVASGGCGASPPPRWSDHGAQDDAEPAEPSCAHAPMQQLAVELGATLDIELEPIVDVTRTDRIPCRSQESDRECVARARTAPVPAHHRVVGAVVAAAHGDFEVVYELDGARHVERVTSLPPVVDRLKQLAAAGHRVTLVRAESVGSVEQRQAVVTYAAETQAKRRVGVLRWSVGDPAAELARLTELAANAQLVVRATTTEPASADKHTLVATISCVPSMARDFL